MAYPPTEPGIRPDRTTETAMSPSHPADHNNDRDAIIDIVNELGADPKLGWSDIASRLADLLQKQEAGGGDIAGVQTVKGPVTFSKTVTISGATTAAAVTANSLTIVGSGTIEGDDEFDITNGQGEQIVFTQAGAGTLPANAIGFMSTNKLTFYVVANGQIHVCDQNGVSRLIVQANTNGDAVLTADNNLVLASGASNAPYARIGSGGLHRLVPSSWVNLSLVNGWANTGGQNQVARVRLGMGDTVDMEGEVDGGTVTPGTTITTLTASYRPDKDMRFPMGGSGVASGSNYGTAAYGFIDASTGAVQIYGDTNGAAVTLNFSWSKAIA